MQFEFALFCDAAKVSPDGMVDILRGGYDLAASPEFPATLHRMDLVLRMICEPKEFECLHELTAQIVDPHGNLLPVKVRLPFTPLAYPDRPERHNRMTLVLNYQSLVFPEPGDYQFRFLVNDVQIGVASLEVVHKPTGT
jgi:hypothetical protein